VQLVEGSVTVKVYVPAVVIPVGLEEVEVNPPGPDQLYVTPAVVEPPVKFTLLTVHVKFNADPVDMFGIPALAVTT
jgi:hypothetical protein